MGASHYILGVFFFSLVLTNTAAVSFLLKNQQEIRINSQVVQVVKNLPANAGRHKRRGFDPWAENIP